MVPGAKDQVGSGECYSRKYARRCVISSTIYVAAIDASSQIARGLSKEERR